MTKTEEDIKQSLQERYEVPVSVLDGQFTKTTQFLLPAIDLNIRKKVIFSYFQNAYLDDAEHEHNYVRPVFVLFKVNNLKDKEWAALFKFLEGKSEFVNEYVVGMQESAYLVMFVFSVPEEQKEIYTLFRKGWYSKFPDKYKEKFTEKVRDHRGELVESIIWGAVHKSPTLKAQVEREFLGDDARFALDEKKDEYWEKPRVHRETYRYPEDKKQKFYEMLKGLSGG